MKKNIYDPKRYSLNSQTTRLKQKMHIKYDKLKQRSFGNSSCSEESDSDDPIRKKLKSKIHKIYKQNDYQLHHHVITFSCLILNRVQK